MITTVVIRFSNGRCLNTPFWGYGYEPWTYYDFDSLCELIEWARGVWKVDGARTVEMALEPQEEDMALEPEEPEEENKPEDSLCKVVLKTTKLQYILSPFRAEFPTDAVVVPYRFLLGPGSLSEWLDGLEDAGRDHGVQAEEETEEIRETRERGRELARAWSVAAEELEQQQRRQSEAAQNHEAEEPTGEGA